MPFSAIVTPDDLKRGDLVDPGWYPVEIVDYKEEPADTDKSTNCIFYIKIMDGPYKGVMPRFQFNEKALGFGKEFYPVVEIPFDSEKGYNLNSSTFRALVGSKFEAYIKRGLNQKNGKEFNEVAGFRKIK